MLIEYCGEMQLPLFEFYEYTPAEFFAYRNGFLKMRDTNLKQELLLTRKLMYAAIMPHAKKGLKETDIMEFDWESEVVEKLTAEDLAAQQQEVKASIDFWKNYDATKINC